MRDKSEYGDFQTPLELARTICRWLSQNGVTPEVLIEPTFGQGHFILAALETFPSLRFVYGVEIYESYVNEAKQSIEHFLSGQKRNPQPSVNLHQEDVFQFSFDAIFQKHRDHKILVLGNPPWVTNASLSRKESTNVPEKSNFKGTNGIDAITGKGNFDIGESVTLAMLEAFSRSNGTLAFLVKNIVVRNIVHSQQTRRFGISQLQQIAIDAKKEFNASVDASLFCAQLNKPPVTSCSAFESFDKKVVYSFGWVAGQFVADVEKYKHSRALDGISPVVWRQGIKHDCSGVMELTKTETKYENSLNESVLIEDELVYPLLKSSDLKTTVIGSTRKHVIVPQKFVGQNTNYINRNFPKTFSYLQGHQEAFDRRKSSIYKGKPPFSVFGIGDYSFQPYKIAISGLYKQTCFSLVLPVEGKPAMLDDTCYFLGMDSLSEAVCVFYLLNHQRTQELFRSLIFWEGKRIITKDILMRLDYSRLMNDIPIGSIIEFAEDNKIDCEINLLREKWNEMQSRNIKKQPKLLFE